jgi:hypothetical protein
MRRYLQHLLASGYALCVAMVMLLGLPCGSMAEEGVGRPWGRLPASPVGVQETAPQRGYLGRYNPWVKGIENSSAQPRYRQRDNAPAVKANQYGYPPPSAQVVPPAVNSFTGQGAAPYWTPPFPAYPDAAPWGGSLSPDYGGYWNDPYDNLQPDRGILWSDMWR